MDLNTFSMIMIGLGALFALAIAVYVIRIAFGRGGGEIGGWEFKGSGRTIAAVARTTVAEGVRSVVIALIIFVILAWMIGIYLGAEGDGTIKGKVQMFMTYSLGFTAFVLSILTILFSCRSLSTEIASRQIYGIVSKPVPRWQILAGKWVGVMSLNVGLLALVAVGTYAGTHMIVSEFREDLKHELATMGGLGEETAARTVEALDHVKGIGKKGMESPVLDAMMKATGMSRKQLADVLLRLPEGTRVNLRRYDELRRQVLVSRAVCKPEIPEEQIEKAAAERLQELRDRDQLPPHLSVNEVREQIRLGLFASICTVQPGSAKGWIVRGPKPTKTADFIMSIRFKMHVASVMTAIVHPETGETLDEDTVLCVWGVGDPQSANYYTMVGTQPARSFQEVEISSHCVEPDGTIKVSFMNLDPRQVDVVFDLPDAIQVLYKVGSFESNLLQTCLALLIPLVCLASFGVCASTFLSFPVGSLIIMCLFLIASSMGFIAEALAVTEEYAPNDPGLAFEVRKQVVETIGWLLSIGDLDPLGDFMEGRNIGWGRLWTSFWKYGLLKSGLVMVIAVLAFRRRELAAVVV